MNKMLNLNRKRMEDAVMGIAVVWTCFESKQSGVDELGHHVAGYLFFYCSIVLVVLQLNRIHPPSLYPATRYVLMPLFTFG